MKSGSTSIIADVSGEIETANYNTVNSKVLSNNKVTVKYILRKRFNYYFKIVHSVLLSIFSTLMNEFVDGISPPTKKCKVTICVKITRHSLYKVFASLRINKCIKSISNRPLTTTITAIKLKLLSMHRELIMIICKSIAKTRTCFSNLIIKLEQGDEITTESHLSTSKSDSPSRPLNFVDSLKKKPRDNVSDMARRRRIGIKNHKLIWKLSKFFFCVLFYSLAIFDKAEAKEKEKKLKMVTIDGDVIFGGMFPMHERGGDIPCGTIKEEKGIQRMEAMLYALDKINSDPDLLPNITLGAMILDTCSSDTYALEQSMEFFRSSLSQDVSAFKCEGGKAPMYDPPKPVIGVIGAASSSVSVMVANILRLFKIPQISYASTSTELSDKTRFDYFSRVVPPDNFQAMAMVQIVKEMGWQYVSTLAVEGGYGEKGIASFVKLALEEGICIAISERIKRLMSKPEEFDELILTLLSKPQARVVVMFVDEDNTRRVLEAAKRANKTNQFLWIGSDSWGAKIHPVRDQEEVARDAITILPQRTSLTGFDHHIRSLRPKRRKTPCSVPHPNSKLFRNCRNIWFKEFWTHHFNCTFRINLPPGKNRKRCTGEEHIRHVQEGLVPFVVDAVYALAHAFHNLILDICGEVVLCPKVHPLPSGVLLLQYIRKVTFIGQQGNEVKFNKDGDAPGSYYIFQYQKTAPNTYEYVRLGDWREKLHINRSKIIWSAGKVKSNSSIYPISICSESCPPGHFRNYMDACCWTCVACPYYAIVFNDTCKPCKKGWGPTEDKVSCYKLTPEFITWDSPWAIVPAIFSSIGLMFTLLTTVIFIRYNKTPIIMASGRELCYVLLIGIAVCYLMTFVILSPPSKPICASFRLGVGLGLCICYSAIFTKTNRISRIFNRGTKSVKRPGYTSPKSQIVICLGLVGVQIIAGVAWLLVEYPETAEVYPERLIAVLKCGISSMSFMISQGYNIILIVLCTVYAFKTRKIPENFNESKYIGFTMYSTCIVWLAFVPIYFVTNNDYKIQLASLCMTVSISASVALGCLFTPKVYIVIFQPYKNVRQGSSQAKGSTHSKNYGGTCKRFTPQSQSAQSVLSTNHSSSQAPPPSTISQHVNGESQSLRPPPSNILTKPVKHKPDKTSIT